MLDLAAVSEQANEKNPPYISLYQFGQPDPLIHYNARGLSRISRLRFDPLGHVFGASDSSGNLTLWRFESQEKAALPFASYACHSNSVNDFCFLGSTTLIATAGQSANNANVCIWDTLLPTSRALIKGELCKRIYEDDDHSLILFCYTTAFNVHEGGAFSLAYAARHQLLFSGGKKGDICESLKIVSCYIPKLLMRLTCFASQASTTFVSERSSTPFKPTVCWLKPLRSTKTKTFSSRARLTEISRRGLSKDSDARTLGAMCTTATRY